MLWPALPGVAETRPNYPGDVLLTVIAQEGADQPSVDERPAALPALLVIGLGLILATTRPDSPALATGLTDPRTMSAATEPVPE